MFFKLSEKQPVVLSNQPVVLLLGVFLKGWKMIKFGWLKCQTKQSVVLWFQPIVSLKILTEVYFDGWMCFKWFPIEYAPSLNDLTNLWKI